MIEGRDGKPKIQMRLDLGALQMEVDGRPDGQTIHGYTSWLEYYTAQQRTHDSAHPDKARFLLDSDDCEKLLREGVQYYHRYISFWHLGKYELCARDTNRNLRLFAFVRDFAKHERDRLLFDQYRPFVTMIHTRAVATPLVELEDFEAALGAIDGGIAAVERFLDEYQQKHRADQCGELQQLKKWREEIEALIQPKEGQVKLLSSPPRKKRRSKMDRLRQDLDAAVEEERYEDAARLRDEIRKLTRNRKR